MNDNQSFSSHKSDTTDAGPSGTCKGNSRARDAYAAHGEDLSSYQPRGSAGGGGLFTEQAGCFGGADTVSLSSVADQAATEATGISREALSAQCRELLCPCCPVKREAEDTRLRALAEVDNARKRMSREKDDHVRFASEGVLADILPALDNLDLALQHAGTDAACKNFIMGVEMTRKLLIDSLQKHGLELVGAAGQLFDPNLHEAVSMANVPTVEDGHIITLLANGYRLRDRLLRPARVIVCKRG